MAEAIFKKIIEEDPMLRNKVYVDSAGVFAKLGVAASHMARVVMREFGLSLEEHRSKPVSDELVKWADIILVMEPFHKDLLMENFEEGLNKVFLLTEYVGEYGSISDPYGGDIREYRETMNRILCLLIKLREKIISGMFSEWRSR